VGGCRRFQGPTAPRASCSWEVPSHKHPHFALALSLFTFFHCQRRIYPVDCRYMVTSHFYVHMVYEMFSVYAILFFRVVYNLPITISVTVGNVKSTNAFPLKLYTIAYVIKQIKQLCWHPSIYRFSPLGL